MKLAISLASVAAVSALAVPKDGPGFFKDQVHHAESLLGDAQSKLSTSFDEAVDFFSPGIIDAIHNAKETIRDEVGEILAHKSSSHSSASTFEYDLDVVDHDLSNLTIFEILSKSTHATKFYELVKDYENVVKLLNDSDTASTLFVPIDQAFENIPEHKKPSDEFVESLLNYHVAVGEYPAIKVLKSHTIPTAYDEPLLGGEPQRIRVSVGISGVRLNVYSKVVAVNIKAKNGYLHAVNKILIPPPSIGRVISVFPSTFSTLLLAYEKTDFVEYIHTIETVGSTVFAPSNSAWKRLGFKANAFLFNTEQGKKYLKALLKYQIVPNVTLYSDEIYYGDENEAAVPDKDNANNVDHFHLELHPLLENSSLGVDVYNWRGWASIVVNGAVKAGFIDAVGKNGVLHVVEDVPLPPHKRGGKEGNEWNGEIEVEDLIERLSEFVDDADDQDEDWVGDL
ncbi:hypothetical protein G7Z17_g1200 [Cylindrodendrum hubeiense]|uniref:FAS1 domain-containing protein n=1 Tax=Cylindrodendrum hubeiense TaxID=595255 RepID=A0A9P5HJQ9_9HYPO|nr:hypothetical protein G7Z17_g1200 [Cylindrodendrum hubeiense]